MIAFWVFLPPLGSASDCLWEACYRWTWTFLSPFSISYLRILSVKLARLIWTMDLSSRWPWRFNMYISCTFTPYRPSGFQLSIKNSSTFERVRVFGLTTTIAWCLLLHSQIPVNCSFCVLSFRLFLFSFLYLHSHMAGAIAKRRWSCIHFGIQGLVGKNTKENISFSQVLSFLSCIMFFKGQPKKILVFWSNYKDSSRQGAGA